MYKILTRTKLKTYVTTLERQPHKSTRKSFKNSPVGIFEAFLKKCFSRPQKKAKTNIYRAIKNISLLLEQNLPFSFEQEQSGLRPLFATFTFKENITDLKQANYEFTKFIQRLTYEISSENFTKVRYLSVPEFQRRGAIHYHTVFFGLPFIQDIKQTFSTIWGGGFIHLKGIKDISHLKSYLTKYLTKSNVYQFNQKAYFCSKGLNKPDKIIDQTVIENELKGFCSPDKSSVFQVLDSVIVKDIYTNLQERSNMI